MSKYQEVTDMLIKEGFEDDVVAIFEKNRIDKVVFMEMDKDDFNELGVMALGDKKRLMILKDKICTEVCWPLYC